MTLVNRWSGARATRGDRWRALVLAAAAACLGTQVRGPALARTIGAGFGAAGQESRAASPVVGTWQVVEWWVRDSKSGGRQYPYGRQPSGFCVYDRTGHVFVQVAGSAEALGEGRWRSLSHDDLRKLVEQQLAYFGTYAVDTGRGILTEHVEHDLVREQAGRARDIPYRLDGDRLILGDGTAWQAVLMRTY